ncbi:hypothetical protein [Methylocella sp.]|uniref:hypothetical protein n=1 Tax=Methylocella sp. TaxID=1978226 RepID=UPI0035AD7C95
MTNPLILSAAAPAMSGLSAGAQAADLGPAFAPAPVHNWTGVYLGLNGGGAWGSRNPYEAIANRFDNDAIPFGGGLLGGAARGFDGGALQDIGGRLGEINCSGPPTRLGATVGAGANYRFGGL